MGSKKNINMSNQETEVKVVETQAEVVHTETKEDQKPEAKTVAKKVEVRTRGKKYANARSMVDKTKLYDPFSAIELVKKLTFTKFDSAIDASIMVKEAGASFSFSFPHSTGKTVRVAIVSDELLKKIEAGEINFDFLVSTSEFMPKLAKLAKVLGPKGLMPNPKNGTLTPNPEMKKKELEGGKMTIKTEKKAPLVHLSIGKTSTDTKHLVENLQALLKVMKGKIVKMSISSSMSPGIKVEVEQ